MDLEQRYVMNFIYSRNRTIRLIFMQVGISTNKIHARGPVGLEGLMIYKYKLLGDGQGAGSYGSGEGKKAFLHEPIAF